MQTGAAISMQNLGKRYRLGQTLQIQRTFRETLSSLPRHLLNRFRLRRNGIQDHLASSGAVVGIERVDTETPPGTFWALRGIDLEIQKGDVVGLIGSNGAGKSTLLKILSRITSPTTGRAELRGRIASLLEVGTGFNQELTGRENIFLNAAILGMRAAEIRRRFDEIVEFSEVGKFLDTPVKRYSSGMYVRLAFAVAAHLESEVLLVDEVLAVGDAEFQRKCLGRMRDLSTTGRTVIYVSHNMSSVRTLCEKAIHLEKGNLVNFGPVDEVIQGYLQKSEHQGNEVSWPDVASAPGNEKARITAVRVLNSENASCRVGEVDNPIIVEVDYAVLLSGSELSLNLFVYNEEDVLIFHSPSFTDGEWFEKPHPQGSYRSRCTIPGSLLNKGYFFASVYMLEKGHLMVARLVRVVGFELVDLIDHGGYHDRWAGVIRPHLEWATRKIK